MNREEAEIAIKAAVMQAAVAVGVNDAVKLLEKVIAELRNTQRKK